MTQMKDSIAGECALALVPARRAMNLLCLGILSILLIQIAVFFAVRLGGVRLSEATTAPAAWLAFCEYITAMLVILACVLAVLLGGVLLLMLMLTVVGRLGGAAPLTEAFLWSLVAALLLMPWQAVLNFPGAGGADFRIPGVLYTWAELAGQARFDLDSPLPLDRSMLKWARFVGFPLLTVMLFLGIQLRVRQGLRESSGGNPPRSIAPTPAPVATGRPGNL
jgi:hypothetical protein